MSTPLANRRAAATLLAALAVLVSYLVQRLLDARGAAPMGTVFMQASVPYFWRIAMAVVHGAGTWVLVRLALTEGQAAWALRRAPLLVSVVVAAFLLVAFLVP